MRRRSQERAVQMGVDQLVEEARAILSGRLAQRQGTGHMPSWARVNRLAHADWDALAAVVDQPQPARWSAWDGADRFLAAELLSAAETPRVLAELQRMALIPLELDMLAGDSTIATPTELVQVVRSRLARARSRRIHPSAG